MTDRTLMFKSAATFMWFGHMGRIKKKMTRIYGFDFVQFVAFLLTSLAPIGYMIYSI